MQQGSNTSATATLFPPQLPSPGTSAQTLTDEQILGLDDVLKMAGPNSGPQSDGALVASDEDILNRPGAALQSGAQSGDAANEAEPGETSLTGEARPINRGASSRGPQAADFASEPAWLKTLEAQPAAAAEARQWRDAARDISHIDAAYFSAEPGARAGLAERLYQSDPAAFRSMLADSARMLAARDPQGLAELARQLGMRDAARPKRSSANRPRRV